MPQLPTLLFVHGALVRDADWWWEPMRAPLAALGIDSLAVRLPSCGEAGDHRGDLRDDVAAVRQAIARLDGPVVLLGHSYGGMVITDAGADDRVTELLYVTSVMPEAGQAQGELASDHPAPWVVPGDDGTVSADPQLIRDLFLQDCDPQTTEQALARLTSQPVAVFTQGPQHAAWENKPASYFICTRDLAFPEDVQRRRLREQTHAISVDAGHHPFLSRPDAFAASVAAEIRRQQD